MNSIAEPVSLTLVPHPATPPPGKLRVNAVVGTAPGGILALTFILQGDISALRIPASRSSRRAGNLWRQTCFEVFAMAEDGPGYLEFNFSPSGEWAVYIFNSYRNGGGPGVALNPGISVRRTEERLELHAEICQDLLPSGSQLRLGLSAVVEEADGVLSYWALRHPPGEPDFHHAGAFALQLGPPGMREVNNSAVGVKR